MKTTKLLSIALVTLALALSVVAAQTNSTPVTRVRELIIWVTPTTNLFAHKVRVTIGDAYFDSITGVPVTELNIEAWNTNSNKIVTSESHAFTAATAKTTSNAPDPRQAVKAAALAKVGMVEKP